MLSPSRSLVWAQICQPALSTRISRADMKGFGVPIDGNRLASDHLGRGRGEEETHIGDFFRLDEALDRLGLDLFLVDKVERDVAALCLGPHHTLHARSVHRTWADCIRAYVIGSDLDGKRF